MATVARAHKKRVRDPEAEPVGPKPKRCTNCTSTESVDMCESIFHEAGRGGGDGEDGPAAVEAAKAAAKGKIKAQDLLVGETAPQKAKLAKAKVPAETGAAAEAGSKNKARRLVWNERMHVKFLSIIFDIGLEHASPRKILDRWGLFERGSLDSGHIKSHLQKYRSNSKRTKDVFKEQLEAALKQACDDQINVHHSYPFPRGAKNPISSLDMRAIMDEDHDCPFVPCPSEHETPLPGARLLAAARGAALDAPPGNPYHNSTFRAPASNRLQQHLEQKAPGQQAQQPEQSQQQLALPPQQHQHQHQPQHQQGQYAPVDGTQQRSLADGNAQAHVQAHALHHLHHHQRRHLGHGHVHHGHAHHLAHAHAHANHHGVAHQHAQPHQHQNDCDALSDAMFADCLECLLSPCPETSSSVE